MSHWAVVGSGPSGKHIGERDLLAPTVVVVNMAVEYIPPQWIDYHLFRHPRLHRFFDRLIEHDVKLLSFPDWHEKEKQKSERLTEPPEWIGKVGMLESRDEWLKDKNDRTITWERGTYSPYRDPIGPQAVQFCVNNGATLIECWGLEGGPWKFVEYDSRTQKVLTAKNRGRESLMDAAKYHRKIIQAVIDECPDVEFIFYGDLMYALEGDNVRTQPWPNGTS